MDETTSGFEPELRIPPGPVLAALVILGGIVPAEKHI